MPQQSRLLLRTALLLCLPLVTLCAPRAFGQASSSTSDAVYIAAFRTPAHVNRSSAQIFRELVDEVLDRLKDKRVPMAKDPSRPMIRSEEAMPVPTLVNAAKDSGASSLLVLTVDRPATS